MVKYLGWLFSVILLMFIAYGWNYMNIEQDQWNSQTTNLTANYDSLLVQYEQLRTDYDALAAQGLQEKARLEANLKAVAERNEKWEVQFNVLLAENEQWRASYESVKELTDWYRNVLIVTYGWTE
jgi:hypothetical protein|tara:strand:+ start:3177 stop:3551 length:375 start_codon:yes stop_codon:yes gene_type:complete